MVWAFARFASLLILSASSSSCELGSWDDITEELEVLEVLDILGGER